MNSIPVDNYLDQTRIRRFQKALDFAMKNVENEAREQFVIAFCGIFSSGKSSLLNEILKQDFKLPTGGEPVTKFVTRIEYGKVFKAYYVDGGNRVYLEENTVEDLVRGKSKLPIKCKEIVLQMPAEILKHKIVLLDTPGYEDDKKLEAITKKAVRSADMAVFCCNADHFGRRFEQEYFQELEDSLGNYLVVVNHADVIHTDEEFERLIKYVEEIVDNRGSRKLNLFCEKTLFFTVGAGRYVDLDGLDLCLSNICNSPRKDLTKVIDYASLKKLLFCSKKLLPAIKEEINKGEKLYKDTDRAIQMEYESAKEEYGRQEQEVKKAIELFRGFIRDNVYQRIDRAYNSMEQLETEGKHTEFVSMAAQILKNQFFALPGDMKNWKSKNSLLKGRNLDIFSGELTELLNSYRVPAPVGKQVKNRGVIGSLLVSGIVSTLTLSPYWDDGYDMEYHGYAKAAQKNIKESFLSKLDRLIDKYLDGLYMESRPIMRFFDTSVLERIRQCLDEWTKLQKKVEFHIVRIEKLLNYNKKILICSTSFACGKGTLFNALIKKELVNAGNMPYDLTTIVESTKPGKTEKVIYTYSKADDSGKRKEVEQEYKDDKIGRELSEFACCADALKNNYNVPLYKTLFLDNIPKGYAYICLKNSFCRYSYFSNSSINEEFLCSADAIVYVIDATRPFTMDEKRTVELFFVGLENIFFVINKIDHIGTDGTLLKKLVLERLKPVFTDKKGKFNAKLYKERVFYTDAFAALNTRMGRETHIARNLRVLIPDSETGVLDLEKALYNFLE